MEPFKRYKLQETITYFDIKYQVFDRRVPKIFEKI